MMSLIDPGSTLEQLAQMARVNVLTRFMSLINNSFASEGELADIQRAEMERLSLTHEDLVKV